MQEDLHLNPAVHSRCRNASTDACIYVLPNVLTDPDGTGGGSLDSQYYAAQNYYTDLVETHMPGDTTTDRGWPDCVTHSLAPCRLCCWHSLCFGTLQHVMSTLCSSGVPRVRCMCSNSAVPYTVGCRAARAAVFRIERPLQEPDATTVRRAPPVSRFCPTALPHCHVLSFVFLVRKRWYVHAASSFTPGVAPRRGQVYGGKWETVRGLDEASRCRQSRLGEDRDN